MKLPKLFYVCSDCLRDLHRIEMRKIKLPGGGSGYVENSCKEKPRCFEQPQRLKQVDIDREKD